MRTHEHDEGTTAPERSPGPRNAGPVGPAEEILALQRTIGNAATARLVEEARGSSVHEVLRSPGDPLPEPLRADMEARLGADFSSVRVHADSTARRSATEIGARAYTSGEHVVIGAGEADPHTMAHELTHVIQQRSGPVSGTDNGSGLAVSDPTDRFEQAAEAGATRAMAGPAPDHSAVEHRRPARAGGTVQRIREVQEGDATFQLTETNKFAVFRDSSGPATPDSPPYTVWALAGEQVSDALVQVPGSVRTIEGRGYQEYQTRRWLLSDCLHTAEEIINDRPGELASADELPDDVTGDEGLNSRIKIGTAYESFGTSDEDNVELARRFQDPKDNDANAGLNQAFVTIASDPNEEVELSPYHAGAVVAVDGADRVTLEEWHRKGYSGRGTARVYTVGSNESSFHAVWNRKYFEGSTPITVVIDPSTTPGQLFARNPPLDVNTFELGGNRELS